MLRYVATIRSVWSAERAFAYMADFRNASEWDPSVVSATALDEGPVREGSGFELRIRSCRRVVPYRYTVTALEARRITLRARTGAFDSVDTITVRDAGTGSEITYDATLAVKGALVLVTPLIARTFRRTGNAADARLCLGVAMNRACV